METRWLETFVVAARAGSMSAAAERLAYARSTVTGHIQSLERALGAKLLDRRSQGQPLTLSGVALLEHAENILDSMKRARAAVVEAEEGRSAPLQLGATESVTSYRLPVFLRMMGRFIPDLSVEVETATVSRLCEQVLTGRPSVVLVNGTHDRLGSEAADPALVSSRVLWEEDVCMVGIPAAAARPKRVLLTRPGCVYREITDADFLGRLPGVEPVQVGSLDGVKSSVLAGLGVGLLPVAAVQPWLAGGQLVELPLRTERKVVTEVVWNRRTCPGFVTEHLRRLGATAELAAS
ncbi:LysR family transcriptional regulator [Kitasatospora kazusensis]|uniref:LysR family transcriptional regulator n=1 Tax=Kitasatospora kazusensis TaxID=407974 RepID=A0ABP5L091_9ACTN